MWISTRRNNMAHQKMDLYNLIDSDGDEINVGDLIDPTTGALLVKQVAAAGSQLVYIINQTGLTSTKNVYTLIPLGFAGTIIGVYGIYTTAAGGSSGAGTIDFLLSTAGQVQSVGPATVTLTLSHTAAVGTVVNQSAAPTLQNTFVATDTLTIHYTQTTTFASDTGVFEIHVITV
jgi:hypothetical protein